MTILKGNEVAAAFLKKMSDPRAQAKNRERLIDSIAGSLRVEGYTVSREEIKRQVQESGEKT